MKKGIKYIICSILLAVSTLSCSKWFNEVPSTQIRDDEQYSTETGFQQVVIGCYLAMVEENLWGRNLSFYIPDILSKQYSPITASAPLFTRLSSYSYSHADVVETIDDMWLSLYNVIANVNVALSEVDNKKHIFHPINYGVIKGELLALRAYNHFQVMRMYGLPNLANGTGSGKMAIPYSTVSSKDLVPQKSYSETIELMKKDLEDAIELLEVDPIRKENADQDLSEINIDGFHSYRTTRLNYYAVKAILAQVLMWEGSTESITEAKGILEDIITDNNNDSYFKYVTDYDNEKSLYPENLFGMNVLKINDNTEEYIRLSFRSTELSLYMDDVKAKSLYLVSGVGSGDNRYSKLMHSYTNPDLISKTVRMTLKYEHEDLYTDYTQRIIPIIRISEVVLMYAECLAKGGDLTGAATQLEHVNEVRGVVKDLSFTTIDEFNEELKLEYAREFFGEGQLFYLYKRMGVEKIVDSAGTEFEMNEKTYTMPYPLFETQNGRVQF